MLDRKDEGPFIRFPSLVLITPMPWLLLQLPSPLPTLTRGLMLWLLLAGLTHSERVARRRYARKRQ